MLLFFAMPGSTVNTCFATAPGCVGRIAPFFFVKGNSRILRSSLSCSWCLGLRVTLNGEVCTVNFSVAFRAGGRTWKLDSISTSPLYLAVMRSLVRSRRGLVLDLLPGVMPIHISICVDIHTT